MPASKTKNRPRSGGQGGRAGSGDGAKTRRTAVRKPPPRRGGYSAFALPLGVLGVFLLVAVALVVLYRTSSSASGPSGEPVANVSCQANEQLATHYHAHLDLVYKGTQAKVPANIGVQPTCLYWLHTHDDTGVIHIEAPKDQAKREFTLGDFFKVWGQPLDSKQVSTFKLQSGEQIKVWVDGKPYTGDPAKIKLASKEQIVIEIGPQFIDPPAFTWDPNTYAQ